MCVFCFVFVSPASWLIFDVKHTQKNYGRLSIVTIKTSVKEDEWYLAVKFFRPQLSLFSLIPGLTE